MFERIKKDDYIIITDLSVNEENEKRIEEFVQKGGSAKLIDHHQTALHFNHYSWGCVQVKQADGKLASATSLLYDYLVTQQMMKRQPIIDEFVELVRQYDTWEWDENENVTAKRLNDLFYILSIEEFEERMLDRIQTQETFQFDEFEEKILDMEEEKIDRYIRRKKREIIQTFVGTYCVGIVHAENYHSELGNELGMEFDYLDYIAIVSVGGRRISFRTIHDSVDVSEVAGHFGGGGHVKASGCSLTEEAYELFVAQPFKLEPIKFDAFRNVYNTVGTEQGTLYESKEGEQYFVFFEDGSWSVESNGRILDQFESSKEAIHYIKRNFAAWLVRDDVYVNYLRDQLKQYKKQHKQNKNVSVSPAMYDYTISNTESDEYKPH